MSTNKDKSREGMPRNKGWKHTHRRGESYLRNKTKNKWGNYRREYWKANQNKLFHYSHDCQLWKSECLQQTLLSCLYFLLHTSHFYAHKEIESLKSKFCSWFSLSKNRMALDHPSSTININTHKTQKTCVKIINSGKVCSNPSLENNPNVHH